MVRASASTSAKKGAKEEKPQTDPEAENRKRLKSLAFSKNLLSRAAAKPVSPLPPSKTLQKHQSRDIVKKGQRKNRFLFSFPGLLAPVSGGKIGELKDLGTKNPILYLDFPQETPSAWCALSWESSVGSSLFWHLGCRLCLIHCDGSLNYRGRSLPKIRLLQRIANPWNCNATFLGRSLPKTRLLQRIAMQHF